MINIMACSPTLWAPEHLPVSVEIVLHEVVLWALEGVELEEAPPAGVGLLHCGGYLEKFKPKSLDA